jgi:hypothetical protein
MSEDRNDEAARLLRQLYDDLQKTGSSERVSAAATFLTDDIAVELRASLANILTHHHFHTGDYAGALAFGRKWLAYAPESRPALNSLLSVLGRLQRWEEVVAIATEQLAAHRDDFRLLSSLCRALGRLGRVDEAKAYGTHCLMLKDRSATAEPFDLHDVPVPPFSGRDRSRNVISFSLFGETERYLRGAVTNVRAARFVYPDWTCRFYIDDSVPRQVVQILAAEGAELRTVDGLPSAKYGTFWRFLVAEDGQVARYVVRDCDSVVNVRERLAVDEWIESRRHFHVMRDAYAHSELVLAGMWGGVVGALPAVGKAFIPFVEQTIRHRTLDQDFLRERLWPTIRQSVLVHDSQFAFGEHRDFPRLGQLPEGHHVGMS